MDNIRIYYQREDVTRYLELEGVDEVEAKVANLIMGLLKSHGFENVHGWVHTVSVGPIPNYPDAGW